MRKIVIVLLLVLLGVIPIAFTDCSRCNCDGFPSSQDATIKSIGAEVYYDYRVIDTLNGYPFDSAYVNVWATDFDITNKQFSLASPGFSFVQTAYACSDCDGYTQTTTLNHITSIEILSKTDTVYTDSIRIQNGASLSNLFSVTVIEGGTFYAISSFLKTYKMPNYNQRDFRIILNTKPSNPVSLVFDLKITLSDRKKFVFENLKLKVR